MLVADGLGDDPDLELLKLTPAHPAPRPGPHPGTVESVFHPVLGGSPADRERSRVKAKQDFASWAPRLTATLSPLPWIPVPTPTALNEVAGMCYHPVQQSPGNSSGLERKLVAMNPGQAVFLPMGCRLIGRLQVRGLVVLPRRQSPPVGFGLRPPALPLWPQTPSGRRQLPPAGWPARVSCRR